MNSSALANTLGLIDAHDVGLIGLPAEKPAQRSLPGSTDNLLKGIAETLDEMIAEVISKRTAEDFSAAVQEAFPQYASLVVAFARVASKVLDRKTVVRLNAESFSMLEAEIRAQGETCFGEALKERAMFTVWMLRKISDLLGMLQTATASRQKEKEAEFAEQFLLHALRARFFIDCLVMAMRKHQPLYREVHPEVDDGLRSIVNAYAWVKQAVDLRLPPMDEDPFVPEWTDDDQDLLDSSTHDMDRFGRNDR